MTDEAFSVVDASGCKLCEQLMVDGLQMPTFGKPPGIAAAIIRNIPDIKVCEDDVMLCTFPKSGTNWGYEIMTMLLNGKAEISPTMKLSKMLEVIPESELEKLPSPRILNTHVPLKWLPKQLKEKKTKIVLIVRNPKDVVVSYYYHACGLKMFNYDGKFGDFLKLFLEEKLPYGSWFDYILEFEKAIVGNPDMIHLIYFEDMKENGLEEIKNLAKFLDVKADDELIAAINEKCSFKSLAASKPPPPKDRTKNNFTLFRKGEIGDWKNYFTVAESEAFDKIFQDKMKSTNLRFKYEPSKN
ncbi:sulfotransferase 1B1-like isoform X2 [Mercenaria mercenaria]|nr:sulfotransferase 1B1-like isoform X2 [Mercenaria mercenaria]XP_045199303.1 sulfotransferase 1B1-like isoform X2 [Mercenaria mercenaria]